MNPFVQVRLYVDPARLRLIAWDGGDAQRSVYLVGLGDEYGIVDAKDIAGLVNVVGGAS